MTMIVQCDVRNYNLCQVLGARQSTVEDVVNTVIKFGPTVLTAESFGNLYEQSYFN